MKTLVILLLLWTGCNTIVFGQQAAQSSTPAPDSHYMKLAGVLAHYDELASGMCYWTFFSPNICLRQGDRSELVPGLRNNLIVLGDLDSRFASGEQEFDTLLTAALMHFQKRNGLAEDGVLNEATIEAMNVPLSVRADQLRLNMTRWKQFEANISQPYLLVNIPDFTLEAIEHNEAVLKMRVVVGKTATKTPTLQSEVKFVVLNPSWNVPFSIANNEILLLQKRNPNYLKNNQMKLYKRGTKTEVNPDTVNWSQVKPGNFDLAIEQMPGNRNALGKVKFLYPNAYDIYLHDTPQKSLFSHRVRTYSHGCVRVEKPLELAAYLLKDNPDWNLAKLREYTQKSSETKTIKLTKPVSIAITYFTAWVDGDNQVQFRPDVYQLDKNGLALEPNQAQIVGIPK